MKAKELREMTDVELNKQLKDLKAEEGPVQPPSSARHQPAGQPIRIDAVKKRHRPRDDHHGREER